MADSNCRKQLKLDLTGYAAGVGRKYGAAAYEQLASTFNAVIATAVASVNAYLNLVAPLFLLDDLVLNTLVLPPMNAAINAADSAQKDLLSPLSQIGASSNKCPDTSSVSKSVNKLRDLATFDVTGLRNKRDDLVAWMEEDSALQKELQSASNVLSDLSGVLPPTWEEFKTRYPGAFGG